MGVLEGTLALGENERVGDTIAVDDGQREGDGVGVRPRERVSDVDGVAGWDSPGVTTDEPVAPREALSLRESETAGDAVGDTDADHDDD